MSAPLLAVLIAAAATLALAVWMLVIEPRLFRVRRVLLDAEKLGLSPLRVLHLTDMHFDGRDGPILGFLARLARAEAFDLVFWTGDLIDTPAGFESVARAALLFRPRLGTFAVLGGHDYSRHGTVEAYLRLLSGDPNRPFSRANPVETLVQTLEEAGVRVLEDRSCVLDEPGRAPMALVGLRDAFMFTPDYDAAWDGVPDGVPALVLAHSPDVLPAVSGRKAPLAFCGHTHGGQVRLPFVGAVVTRSNLPGRLASGTFRVGGTTIVINNGLGTSAATPFRLLCRPEATIAEVVRSSDPRKLTPVREVKDG